MPKVRSLLPTSLAVVSLAVLLVSNAHASSEVDPERDRAAEVQRTKAGSPDIFVDGFGGVADLSRAIPEAEWAEALAGC